ncbi:uncharacterized protein LOC128212002 [Mya arenaria]|uniref:uncharacterized protein LOC128212002 n=1 Tax=Mya arenaria TaxID=6604 RepID=UPI0022E1F4EA|nr:uncharacterized protein LOC128212002 [Mya arenaria]
MHRILQHTLPPEAYPRYKHTCQNVHRLNRKSHKLITKCGVRNDTNFLELGDVVINVICKDQSDLIDVKTLPYKTIDLSSNIQSKILSFDDFTELKCSTLREGLKIPTIFLADYETLGAIPSFFGRLIILVTETENNDIEHLLKANDVHIWISTKERLPQNICNMLEMYALRHIRERTDMLLTMTGECNEQPYYRALKECLGGQANEINSHLINPLTSGGDTPSAQPHRQYSSESAVEEYLTVSKEEHVRLVEENKQSIRDLHCEIIAMYGRSNLPDNEKPKPRDIDPKFNECIAGAILHDVSGVKGLGYRFGTLNFFTYSNNLNNDDEQRIVSDINESLKGLNIKVDNYVLRFGTKYVNFSSNCW